MDADLPQGSPFNILFPPGTASQDAHAGVGTQTTLVDINTAPPAQSALLFDMIAEANLAEVGLIV